MYVIKLKLGPCKNDSITITLIVSEMGHGYFCVLGYGITISIVDFVKIFPEFVENEDEIRNTHKIELHFEQQYEPKNIFICSNVNYLMDTRCGEEIDVDIEDLSVGKENIEDFVNKYFPEEEVTLKMYGYQGS